MKANWCILQSNMILAGLFLVKVHVLVWVLLSFMSSEWIYCKIIVGIPHRCSV